jgi:cell division protein FtsB
MVQPLNPTTRIILIAEFIVAIYMLIALTTSEYESFKVERYIEEFEDYNQELAMSNDELKNDYAYFTSPEYQEKVAKQNFGLINPGEEVLIIPDEKPTSDEAIFEDALKTEKLGYIENLSNPVKWWYFLFKASY